MLLGTPRHRATLWILANAAWIAVSPAAALYFDRQLRKGAYPVDADSIGLPIMGIAVWVMERWLDPYFLHANGPLIQFGALSLLVGFGLAVYAGAVLAFGIVDPKDLMRRLRRRR